jgi:two-component system cell cycle sensor histidine kinase/response regulator CckA
VLPTKGRIMSAVPQSQPEIDRLPNAILGEQSLIESARMDAFGRLACGVAHDFNNLLTGIMLYCDLLIAGLENNCPLRCHAEEIRAAGLDGVALIQRLLTVARPPLVEARLLSGNEVISGSKNFMTRMLGEQIELVTVLSDDLGCVRMDPAQVRRILFNLVLNARDAMPQGGRVTLETRNSTNWLPNSEDLIAHRSACIEFTVTDTGRGMDAETRSHLFEPFFTTKNSGDGNGLGLVTVNTIVKQHGGVLQVESRLGQGTRVIVRLPRVASSPPQRKPHVSPFIPKGLSAPALRVNESPASKGEIPLQRGKQS